ncbi:glucosaminidase domain-containing protein [Aquisalimonas asiatica]|uniref:glucosaminidase domain-containing protein n=1 Tax=Aquisalimonas asiatica TaxID=406100 RepID=UPI00149564B1|nr:glucosaminidase domain-containing protein [Aquisalimonas asiatica]
MSDTHAAEHGLAPTDHRIVLAIASVIAVTAALALAWQHLRDLEAPSRGAEALAFDMTMAPVEADSAAGLADTLDAMDFPWPPEGPVPRIQVEHFPDDMAELDADTRKTVFFRALLPLVLYENAALSHHRDNAGTLLQGGTPPEPGSDERAYLGQLKDRFRVDGDLDDAAVRQQLLRRVDAVPASLALAQAANESGWGTSRFTLEANNLFGEWTWNEDQGLLPQQRAEGATHFVRIFPDLHGSVRSYIHNINVGHAYGELRQQRANLREQGEPLDGIILAEGLIRYSERGQAYVDEVRAMIRQNGLHQLPDLELADDTP